MSGLKLLAAVRSAAMVTDSVLLGDFHDGDVVRSRSTGAEMTVHHDGDPWSVRHYELASCPHEEEFSVR